MRGGLSGIEPDYTIGLEVTSSAPWLHRCRPLRSPCSRKQVFLQDAAFDVIVTHSMQHSMCVNQYSMQHPLC